MQFASYYNVYDVPLRINLIAVMLVLRLVIDSLQVVSYPNICEHNLVQATDAS